MNYKEKKNIKKKLSFGNKTDLELIKKSNFLTIEKKFLGVNKYLSNKILSRFEFNKFSIATNLSNEYFSIIITLKHDWLNSILILKKKILVNIYFYFLISNFKGNRHELGLPLNGQRTWSNKKTCKKLNSILILFLKNKNS